jgi:peptidoglycan/LPS O-acetylase OafA/YrhL
MRQIAAADVWVPFARLTYAAYLYHPIIIQTYYSSREVLPLYVTSEIVLYFFGFASLAFATSCIHFLLFEKPTMNLEAMFLH